VTELEKWESPLDLATYLTANQLRLWTENALLMDNVGLNFFFEIGHERFTFT
jgi:hypothetical protein